MQEPIKRIGVHTVLKIAASWSSQRKGAVLCVVSHSCIVMMVHSKVFFTALLVQFIRRYHFVG